MEERINRLSLRLEAKGFRPEEIRQFVKDVVTILDRVGLRNLAAVNQELEDLGWGVEILDKNTYELIEDIVTCSRLNGA